MVQERSNARPVSDDEVAAAAAETLRRAEAVGLIEEAADLPELTYPALTSAVSRVREAGIAESAARAYARTPKSDTAAIARLLREIAAVIEQSPLPNFEWPRLVATLERERLASLLGISLSSAQRYERGTRRTPDDVAARLHFLALLVGDLAGAYNDIGIRRWFDRPRTQLDGRRPAELLNGDWQPEDPGPGRVRELARALVESPAT
jgi:hypothetical protein